MECLLCGYPIAHQHKKQPKEFSDPSVLIAMELFPKRFSYPTVL
jgi:hypothetical protein